MTDEAKQWAISIGLILAILFACAVWGWWQAGIQQQVWEREGIHMTRWEVFMGAKPATRQMIGEKP